MKPLSCAIAVACGAIAGMSYTSRSPELLLAATLLLALWWAATMWFLAEERGW